jgi:hypothetical protein
MAKGIDEVTEPPDGPVGEWSRPVRDGAWTDGDGVVWRRRGGPLETKVARRFLRRPELIVLHAYGLEPHVVDGPDADALLARVQEFLDGDAPAYSEFTLGDFRDDSRRTMLVVEETC